MPNEEGLFTQEEVDAAVTARLKREKENTDATKLANENKALQEKLDQLEQEKKVALFDKFIADNKIKLPNEQAKEELMTLFESDIEKAGQAMKLLGAISIEAKEGNLYAGQDASTQEGVDKQNKPDTPVIDKNDPHVQEMLKP